MNSTELIWQYQNPFIESVYVTADVIDGLNHTNNTAYVKWCEFAAWQHSDELGLGLADYKKLNRAMAIVKADYEYLQATRLGQELLIGTWLVACDGKLSCERKFEIKRKQDGQTVAKGVWKLICIDIATGKPKRMPNIFRDVYCAAIVNS